MQHESARRHLSAGSTERRQHISKTVRELATLKHSGNTTEQTLITHMGRVVADKRCSRNVKYNGYFRAYPLFDEVMKYKQCSVKAGRWVSLFLSPTLVISEWVYLSALVVPASLRPSTIIPLGCGKLVNPRLAIGHPDARDGNGERGWSTSSLPAPQMGLWV